MNHLFLSLFFVLLIFSSQLAHANLDSTTVILENSEELKAILGLPPSDASAEKLREESIQYDLGLVPESFPNRGVIISSYNPSGYELNVHKAIIGAVPEDYWVVVFTNDIRPYNVPEFANKRNLKIVVSSSERFNHIFWIRDYFPETVVRKGKIGWVKFGYADFDASKIQAWIGTLKKELNIDLKLVDVNLEGGNILLDLKHRLFVSDIIWRENGILTPGATSETEQKKMLIAQKLKKELGVKTVIVLPSIPGDATGHIDMFAKIVISPRTGKEVALVSDSRWLKRKQALDNVANVFKDKGFEVVRIMNTDPILLPWGLPVREDLTLTYTNSFILGQTVLMPVYGSEPGATFVRVNLGQCPLKNYIDDDKKAADVYRRLGFKVKEIPSADLIQACGAIHCVTRPIY